jgi:hypothetical protein
MYIAEKDLVLEPFIKVGAFRFETHYSRYSGLLEPWDQEEEIEDSATFDMVGTESFLSTDKDGKIEHITCKDECNYRGVNLIGKSLDEVEKILGYEGVVTYPEINSDVHSIDKLGLTIWVEEGIVVTIGCMMYIDPDEV